MSASLVRFEVDAIISGFMIVVGWKLLTGRINLRGLLSDGPGRPISPTKAQMLVISGGAVLAYLQQVGATLGGSAPNALPQPSDAVLMAFGGSQLVYLGGQLVSATGGLRWRTPDSPNSGS